MEPRIVIEVRGGNVVNVHSTEPITYIVLDHDNMSDNNPEVDEYIELEQDSIIQGSVNKFIREVLY